MRATLLWSEELDEQKMGLPESLITITVVLRSSSLFSEEDGTAEDAVFVGPPLLLLMVLGGAMMMMIAPYLREYIDYVLDLIALFSVSLESTFVPAPYFFVLLFRDRSRCAAMDERTITHGCVSRALVRALRALFVLAFLSLLCRRAAFYEGTLSYASFASWLSSDAVLISTHPHKQKRSSKESGRDRSTIRDIRLALTGTMGIWVLYSRRLL